MGKSSITKKIQIFFLDTTFLAAGQVFPSVLHILYLQKKLLSKRALTAKGGILHRIRFEKLQSKRKGMIK